MADADSPIRLAAFAFLAEQVRFHGDNVLPRTLLAGGFDFEGRRVPLMGPQGIFKPAVLADMPLSITSVPVVEGRERQYRRLFCRAFAQLLEDFRAPGRT